MDREQWDKILDVLAAGDFNSGKAFGRIIRRHLGERACSRLMAVQENARYRWGRRLAAAWRSR
jgi:hypothetical protein